MTYKPPTALPRSVLDDEELQAALAAHDFGKVFRLVRRRTGISYSRLAAACDLNPSRVGTLARGQGRITTYDKIAQIADALRVPGHLVGLAPRPWETSSGRTDAGSVLPNHIQQSRRNLDATGSTAELPLPHRPLAPRQVTVGFVDRLHRHTARLRRLDNILGGVDTYDVYLAEYEATKGLLRTAAFSPESRRRTVALLAEQAQQTGWAAFDAGRLAEAARLYGESKDAAREAGDSDLMANADVFLAYQTPDRNGAAEVAARSCAAITAGTPPRVRALLHERTAFLCAAADRPESAQASLDAARSALQERPDADQGPDWAAWVNDTELDIMTGRCWTELRRPLRAVPVLTDALARYDDAHARDKALFMTWLAQAYLTAGEIEQAANVTGRALDLSAGIASVRLQNRMAPVLTRLSRHPNLTAVQEVLAKAA